MLIVFFVFNTQEAKGTGKWFQWMTWDQASVTKHTHTHTKTMHTSLWFNIRLSSSDAYSTLDQRGRRNTLDNTLEPADRDAVQVNTCLMRAHTHTPFPHITLHDCTNENYLTPYHNLCHILPMLVYLPQYNVRDTILSVLTQRSSSCWAVLHRVSLPVIVSCVNAVENLYIIFVKSFRRHQCRVCAVTNLYDVFSEWILFAHYHPAKKMQTVVKNKAVIMSNTYTSFWDSRFQVDMD